MLFFDGALEEGLDGDFGVHALVDDGMGHFGDGDGDPVLSAQLEGGNAGIDPFDGHPDLLAGPLRGKPLGDEPAVAIVAAVGGKARDAEISEAGEAVEGFWLAVFDDAELADLVEPARHDGGFCVIAAAKAIRNSAGDGHDVFHRTAKTDAEQIGIRIDAERRSVEHLADLLHEIGIVG